MTIRSIGERLDRLGLTQVEFSRMLSHISDRRVDRVTVNRWCTGAMKPSAAVCGLLWLLERRPELVTFIRNEMSS